MAISPKNIQLNPQQNSNDIIYRTRKTIPKFIVKLKRQWIAKSILGRKNTIGCIPYSITPNYTTEPSWQKQHSIGAKTGMYNMEYNRDPEINPNSYGNLIFDIVFKTYKRCHLANDGDKVGYLHLEKWNYIFMCHLTQK